MLSIASGLFGMPGAVVLRIGANVFASIYTVLVDKVLNKIFEWTTQIAPGIPNNPEEMDNAPKVLNTVCHA